MARKSNPVRPTEENGPSSRAGHPSSTRTLTTPPTAPAAATPTTLTITDVLQVLQNTGLQIGALTAQVQNLTTNQAAAMQVATPRPPDLKKTAQPPTNYDGDIKKGDVWLRELYLYFREESFTNDKKITIALSCLQG